jgi:hypothetical protein
MPRAFTSTSITSSAKNHFFFGFSQMSLESLLVPHHLLWIIPSNDIFSPLTSSYDDFHYPLFVFRPSGTDAKFGQQIRCTPSAMRGSVLSWAFALLACTQAAFLEGSTDCVSVQVRVGEVSGVGMDMFVLVCLCACGFIGVRLYCMCVCVCACVCPCVCVRVCFGDCMFV